MIKCFVIYVIALLQRCDDNHYPKFKNDKLF